MAKKVKNTKTKAVQTVEAAEIKVVAPVVAEQPTTTEEQPAAQATATVEEKPQLGRPVDPNSARQKRLAEIAEKRAQGLIKRGRPVIEGSAHQQKLKAQAERKEANGGEARRGRPVDPNSPRQQRLREMEAKKAAGVEIKRGRPAMEKPSANNSSVTVEVTE